MRKKNSTQDESKKRPTKLKAIPGALSIYREGDEVDFMVDGRVQLSAIVTGTCVREDGSLRVLATAEISIPQHKIQRIRREVRVNA